MYFLKNTSTKRFWHVLCEKDSGASRLKQFSYLKKVMKQRWRRSGTGKGFLKSQKINKGRSVVMMGLGRPGFN